MRIRAVKLVVAAVLLTLLLHPWWQRSPHPDRFLYRLEGSDTMLALAQAWARAYAERRPEVAVAVSGGGSGSGLTALLYGHADLALASRAVAAEELELARATGRELRGTVVAFDGVALIVHGSNPVAEIDYGSLRGLLTGRIGNWRTLGGEDTRVLVMSREANSGTYAYLKDRILGGEEFERRALLLPSSQDLIQAVARDRGALGYVGLVHLTPAVKALRVRRGPGQPAVAPSQRTARDGTYPLARPLYLYWSAYAAPGLLGFVDFILGSEGQRLVEQVGFVARP